MGAGSSRTAVYFFSDIEGSTRLWENFSEAMKTNIARHDEILDSTIERHGGRVIDHAGDGVFAVFDQGNPLQAALDIQRGIQDEAWTEIDELRIRIGLHAGQVPVDTEDPRGPLANRTARIMDAAHGGQIVATPAVLDRCDLPEGADVEDLGSHRLKDLTEPQPIYGLIHPDLALQSFPALRSLSAHPHNLPTQTTPFVGRADELATITHHLTETDNRLLTLLGPGGAGKSRLAIQAAAEHFETFPDGVFFVPLSSVPDVASVVYAVADAIGFTFYSNEAPQTQLINYLEGKTLMVVLDNCEHLPGVNRLISELLAAVPELTALATSRTRLNLKGEVVLDLEGLEVPDSPSVGDVDAYGALRLFVDSAERARADFTVDEDDLEPIVRICRLLNGMPLGIELAAAWVRMLPVDEIVEEIESSLDFLESMYEDLPERQRSLRAVFDYSWELLSEQERTAFADLSVFRGEFDRHAAKQVAGVSMMALASLVDKSLLRVDDEGRYAIHNLLRQYALERLGQDPERHREALRRHGEHFATFMEEREPELTGERQAAALDAVQQVFDDVRAMWQTGLDQGEDSWIARSLHALYLFCMRRSRFQEGQALFEAALAAIEDTANGTATARLKYQLQVRLAVFQHTLGQGEAAERLLREALEAARAAGEATETAFALDRLANIVRYSDPQSARALSEESLDIYRDLDDKEGMANCLNNLGLIDYYQGDWETSLERREKSLALYEDIGDKQSIARIMVNIGGLKRQKGNLKEARQLHERSLDMIREIDNKESEINLLLNLGIIEAQTGNLEHGYELLQGSLSIARELGVKMDTAVVLGNLGVIEWLQNDLDRSHASFQQALEITRTIGDSRRMALYMHNLGNVALTRGDADEARRQFEESLTISQDQGQKRAVVENLSGLASVLQMEGQPTRAARLQGSVTALLSELGTAFDPDEQALYNKSAAALQTELGEEGYRQAYEEGQALAFDETINEAMGTG